MNLLKKSKKFEELDFTFREYNQKNKEKLNEEILNTIKDKNTKIPFSCNLLYF